MKKIVPRTNAPSLPMRIAGKIHRLIIEDPARQKLRQQVCDLPSHSFDEIDENLSMHCLLCSSHIEMLICSQRSLYAVTELRKNRLFLHDDGSLTPTEIALLEKKLPNAKVISRSEADKRAEQESTDFPRIREYRKNQIMALKLVDVAIWATGQRTAYIDSDILFFREPKEFLAATESTSDGNFFNKDLADAYVEPRDTIEKEVGIGPAPKINAGLWVADTKMIDLDQIETWLAEPVFNRRPFYYTLDQTFISMLANKSSKGARHFSTEYDVSFDKDVRNCCVKHYVGAIRHGFELEGLNYLLEHDGFSQVSQEQKVNQQS